MSLATRLYDNTRNSGLFSVSAESYRNIHWIYTGMVNMRPHCLHAHILRTVNRIKREDNKFNPNRIVCSSATTKESVKKLMEKEGRSEIERETETKNGWLWKSRDNRQLFVFAFNKKEIISESCSRAHTKRHNDTTQ